MKTFCTSCGKPTEYTYEKPKKCSHCNEVFAVNRSSFNSQTINTSNQAVASRSTSVSGQKMKFEADVSEVDGSPFGSADRFKVRDLIG